MAPKVEEKPVQIATAPVSPQPVLPAPVSTAPAANSSQPVSAPAVAPEPVAPKTEEKEEKAVEVAAATVPAVTAAPESAIPSPEATPNANNTVTASAEPSPSPAEPAPPAPVSTLIARSDDPSLHTVFRVKYVADGVAYLEGGRTQGLTEGMKLLVEDANHAAKQGESVNSADPKVVAELEVSAVADTSAVTDIHNPKRPVKVGDLAYLSNGDTETLVQQRTLSATRQYPAVISFSEGDTLDDEARVVIPRPPLPEINRARGRIGFDGQDFAIAELPIESEAGLPSEAIPLAVAREAGLELIHDLAGMRAGDRVLTLIPLARFEREPTPMAAKAAN